MGLESGTYISDLVVTNPTGSDQRYTADDHIRLIKSVLKNTFPNVDGAVTASEDLINSVLKTTSTKTGAFNVTLADHGRLFLLDASGGAFTVTFDAASTLGDGFRVSFMKTDSSANAVTLDPNGAEQINGANTLAVRDRWEHVDVTCTGTALFASSVTKAVPTGTKMVFRQASAPTGWTQDTTLNDRVLRLVSGAGGGTGGSWTISGLTVAGHALTTNELPAHTHWTVGDRSYSSSGGISAGNTNAIAKWGSDDVGAGEDQYTLQPATGAADRAATSSVGSGQSHSHGISSNASWRPLYTDVIVGIKD